MSMTREEARIELQAMKDDFEEYEPGGSRCQMALKVALSALRPVRREQVEQMRGEWIEYEHPHIICCTRCDYGTGPKEKTRFCPYCGAPMTDEAVEMVMERINEMEETTDEH